MRTSVPKSKRTRLRINVGMHSPQLSDIEGLGALRLTALAKWRSRAALGLLVGGVGCFVALPGE